MQSSRRSRTDRNTYRIQIPSDSVFPATVTVRAKHFKQATAVVVFFCCVVWPSLSGV